MRLSWRNPICKQLGLTTQVPGVYEVYTNKATTEYRETKLANLRVILRKPYCEINERNMAILQFLDLIKEVVDISEVEGEELTNRLFDYMKSKNIEFENMKPFLPYYPERIYKNMYEVGLLRRICMKIKKNLRMQLIWQVNIFVSFPLL